MYDTLTLDYLGVLFHFSVPGEVCISMEKMVQEFLDEVTVAVDARAEISAAHYPYNVDNESESLSNNARETLHSQSSLYGQARQDRPVDRCVLSFHFPYIDNILSRNCVMASLPISCWFRTMI